MLLKLNNNQTTTVRVTKVAGGEDVSSLGAFACGTVLEFTLSVPRSLGAAAVVMRLSPDGGDATDLPLSFASTEGGVDAYCITLDTRSLCAESGYGLFYYEFLFLRGFDTLFSDTPNNVDLVFSPQTASKFRLLVYRADFRVPEWFKGGTMYQVFLDRFCRGTGKAVLHDGAVLDTDWENGIPQFAPHAGDALENNVFFGGNLWGVREKLPYLASLGVTVLYLSPIFTAASNHRYDTADYETVDSLLGGDEAFDALCRDAHRIGIRIILDGVFNHTGDDSRYFNKRGHFAEVGAYQSETSPYADWFSFSEFPDSYECWWGIPIMPRLQQQRKICRSYFTGKGGIAEKWLRRGADGWRLDVADELPDAFLDDLRRTVKDVTCGEGLLLGEVWENAADKIAYGKRRRYLSGEQLDSVMNYPFRNAVLALVRDGDAPFFYDILTELYASYPKQVSDSLMNLLGTHDTERILTLLGDAGEGEELENPELAVKRLTPAQYQTAVRKLRLAAVLQYTVFGVPCIYYGDEAGMEGYHDPFCRRPFPWGHEDVKLTAHYRMLGKLRREHPALCDGGFAFVEVGEHHVVYERTKGKDRLRICVNAGDTAVDVSVGSCKTDALDATPIRLQNHRLVLEPYTFRILYE